MTWLDDHSRYALSVTAHDRVTGPAVPGTFRAAAARYGPPASTLTDNGLVFTTRLAPDPGNVERFQQTMKNWLRAQAHQPATLRELQTRLDTPSAPSTTPRPHRSLPAALTVASTSRRIPRSPLHEVGGR